MEAAEYASLVVSFCLFNIVSASSNYEKRQLESFQMCGFGGSEASLYISPWDAAILTVGEDFQAARNIHRCKVRVKTQEGFGLAAVIEDMRIRGRKDRETNGWVCEDYVKMSTSGTSVLYKFLDTVLPGDLFKSKTTKELCGVQQNRGDGNSSFRFSEVGSNANILSTLASHLTIEFHQEKSNDNPVNNTFTIVITTYKHDSDKECLQRLVRASTCARGTTSTSTAFTQDTSVTATSTVLSLIVDQMSKDVEQYNIPYSP